MSKDVGLSEALEKFKFTLARKLIFVFACLCSIALPLSLSRWFEIGFQYVFLHHILVTVAVFYCVLRSDKSSYKIDMGVIALALSSMIVSGTLSFGLQSGVISFAAFVTFLVMLIWGINTALVFTVIWCVYLVSIGYLFTTEKLTYIVAPNVYAQSMSAWLIVAIGSLISISFLLISAKLGVRKFIGLVYRIKQQKVEIEYLADHDYLTGYKVARLCLPLLENCISNAFRSSTQIAVVFIDLNNFKSVNDQYGHDVGDSLLKATAKRLSENLREVDVSLRVGGDEFVFILPNLNTQSEAEMVIARMIEKLSDTMHVESYPLVVEASIGVAMFPSDATEPKVLYHLADKAMYRAKQVGQKQAVFYSDSH